MSAILTAAGITPVELGPDMIDQLRAWEKTQSRDEAIVDAPDGVVTPRPRPAKAAYTCYLDGVAQTINTSSAFGVTGGNSIGTRFGVSNSFNGKFGDIVFFTKILSSTEATKMHNYLLGA